MIFILVSVFIFSLLSFIFYKKNALDKNIIFLRNILEISFNKDNARDAACDIGNSLIKKYNLDYCTFYVYDTGRKYLNTLYSNVNTEYLSQLESYSNITFTYIIKNEFLSAKAVCNKSGLDYPTAHARKIEYAYLIPLFLKDRIIGAILVENKSFEQVKGFSIEFFNMVKTNIAISIEHLIYFEKIVSSANIDGLTQVYNRNFMDRFINDQIKKYENSGQGFSLVLFDIDHFKKFNDTHGHLFGDKVLQEVCKFVNSSIRSNSDYLFRYGGEEFVIYLANVSLVDAFKKVDEIRENLSQVKIKKDNGSEVSVTCSFGISRFPDHSTNLNDLLKLADSCMYDSKESGRNKVTAYKLK